MRLRALTFLVTSAMAVALTAPLQAQTFNFRWDAEQEDPPATSSKYEDPVNWFNETDGTNFNTFVPVNDGTLDPALAFNVSVRNGGTVDFDEDTSLALTGAADGAVQVNRFFLGAPGSGSGSGTFNVSGGVFNAVQSGAGINNTIGRAQDGTLNISGGVVNVGHRVFVGSGVNGHGEINLTGGEYIISRGGNSAVMTPEDIAMYGRPSLDMGDDDGDGAVDGEGNPIENTTTGIFNISGGAFSTRGHVAIGKYGTVDVQGSGATQIGIGSHNTLDGGWFQYAGGTIRAGVDAGGITPIFIDEVDGNAEAGGNGDVRFETGTFLDPYDLGSAPQNTWHTVMEWEGMLVENGLALTADAMTAGWEMQIDGNLLQVRLPGDITVLFGDADNDLAVSGSDLLAVTNNFGDTGAADGLLLGDADDDGAVSGSDLLAVTNNFGNTAGTAGLTSGAAVPEPTSCCLLAVAGVAGLGAFRRKR